MNLRNLKFICSLALEKLSEDICRDINQWFNHKCVELMSLFKINFKKMIFDIFQI